MSALRDIAYEFVLQELHAERNKLTFEINRIEIERMIFNDTCREIRKLVNVIKRRRNENTQ